MPLITHTHHHYDHGDHSTPIPSFDAVAHKMLETIMAQLDDLQTLGGDIKLDLDQIKTYILSQSDKITALTDQLTQLQQTTPPQVDLQPAIDAATAIKDEADAIVASFTPAPAPAPEPAPAPVEPAPAPVDTTTTPTDTGSTDVTITDAQP